MDLIAYVRILRRRWLVIAALVAVGLVLGAVSWVLQRDADSFYRATHTLVSTGANVNLERAAAVAVVGEVPERVATRVPNSTAAGLAAQVKVVPRVDVGFLEITAVGNDPNQTVLVADAFAEELAAYMSRLDQAGTEAQITALQARSDGLSTEVAELEGALVATTDPAARAELVSRLESRRAEAATLTAQLESLRDAALATAGLQTFATAEAVPISGPQFRALFNDATGADPAAAISGSTPLGLVPRLLLGGTFGLLAGVAAALVLERLDPRLRTKAAAEEVYGWPVITEVPPLTRDQQHDKAVLASSAPRSRTAEAYRVLRSSVLLAGSGVVPVEDDLHRPERSEGDGLVVLVTSASPSEGKTTTVANLAAVLGESGSRVLVVNCDFRRPTLGAYLGVDTHLAKVVDTDVPNVRLLAQVTADPESANPAEVIATQRQVIDEARRRFDVVVLDTAPLLTTNDANDVLDAADLVVVVARAGRTTREAADRCAEILERRRAPVLGVVLVAAADAPAGRYYYYGDYYVDDDPDPKHHRPASTAEHTETVLVASSTSATSGGSTTSATSSGTTTGKAPASTRRSAGADAASDAVTSTEPTANEPSTSDDAAGASASSSADRPTGASRPSGASGPTEATTGVAAEASTPAVGEAATPTSADGSTTADGTASGGPGKEAVTGRGEGDGARSGDTTSAAPATDRRGPSRSGGPTARNRSGGGRRRR